MAFLTFYLVFWFFYATTFYLLMAQDIAVPEAIAIVAVYSICLAWPFWFVADFAWPDLDFA